jgi:hypothetical protein
MLHASSCHAHCFHCSWCSCFHLFHVSMLIYVMSMFHAHFHASRCPCRFMFPICSCFIASMLPMLASMFHDEPPCFMFPHVSMFHVPVYASCFMFHCTFHAHVSYRMLHVSILLSYASIVSCFISFMLHKLHASWYVFINFMFPMFHASCFHSFHVIMFPCFPHTHMFHVFHAS